MTISKRFPHRIRAHRAGAALSIAFLLTLTNITAHANGNAKSTTTPPRPVARLLSTSKQEAPAARAREVLLARASATAPAAARAPRRVVAVAATGDERRAFELVNAERLARGRSPLILDGELTSMARYHSENMAREGFFNHVDRDGLDSTGRAALLGIRGWRALGENIAYNQGYDDPTAFAVERWMISDKHRDNILNREFTHAGIGVAKTPDGQVFFTQVFMMR